MKKKKQNKTRKTTLKTTTNAICMRRSQSSSTKIQAIDTTFNQIDISLKTQKDEIHLKNNEINISPMKTEHQNRYNTCSKDNQGFFGESLCHKRDNLEEMDNFLTSFTSQIEFPQAPKLEEMNVGKQRSTQEIVHTAKGLKN